METKLPFFVRDGERFVPTAASGGYWAPETLNGRVVGGLLGFVLEQEFGEPELVPVRFTVDMFKLPRNTPLRVQTRLIRAGGRIKLADADLFCDDTIVARASCQFLRRSANPANPTWRTPAWSAPAPDALPKTQMRVWEVRGIPPDYQTRPRRLGDPEIVAENTGAGSHGPAAGNPPVLGDLSPFDARQAWTRETRNLVEGVALTPFTRVAVAADFANPLANSSAYGIDFVNSDFTIYLNRLPQTEWIGFELVNHQATDGIALGECWIHDEAGPLGTVNAAAVAQRKR